MRLVTRLFWSIVVCQLAGLIGALFTASAIPEWYGTLTKPDFAPPNWVFGPVWTVLYILMGLALFYVWQKLETSKGSNKRHIRNAIALFVTQLILNAAWSVIFFGLRSPGFAFAEIVAMWLFIAATMVAFSRISMRAVWLLVPYLLWVSFAGYLNFAVWQLSKSEPEEVFCTQEAKQCPDGSYVGRQGPNCEFAACPGE